MERNVNETEVNHVSSAGEERYTYNSQKLGGEKRNINKGGEKMNVICIVCGILVCITLVAPAVAQPTPFVIYGHVFDSDNNPCGGSTVQITNLNTSVTENADTASTTHFYQIGLANGTDLNASEVLRIKVTNPAGNQSKTIDYTVTSEDVNIGGNFNFNVTLETTNTQTWYLTSDGIPTGASAANDGQTHAKDNLMHKGSRMGSGTYFDLNSTKVAWFYADTGAECGLGFGENSWEAHIRTEGIEGDELLHNLTVEICKLDNGTGDVTVLASHTQQLTAVGSKHLWDITCENNGSMTQDFSTGDWLAVRLSWDCTTDPLRIHYNATAGNDSYIESPASDPGYPIPELPTIILFGVGLLVIAGYVGWWRRRD